MSMIKNVDIKYSVHDAPLEQPTTSGTSKAKQFTVFRNKKTKGSKYDSQNVWGKKNLYNIETVNFSNKYIQLTMSVPKHWLLGGWYLRGLIVHLQIYRLSDK